MKILYFSTVNWNWIKQRPHFISYYLSKNNIDVDYFSMTPLLKQKITKTKTDGERLKVNDIYVIPFANKIKAIENLNVRRVKKILSKNSYDIIILTHPFQLKYITESNQKNCKIIYECMDNMPYFYTGSLRYRVKHKEKELCLLAKNIITSSNYLKNRIINEYSIEEKKIFVIKNAVDISFLKNETEIELGLRHPNLMYVGTISEWFDFETINEFACENPQVSIYLVGPAEKGILKKISKYENVILTGPVDHSLVKNYISNADILIVPFRINNVVKAVDPVKVYEYISLNKKIISSYWEELGSFNDKLLFYNDYNSFINCYRRILSLQKNNPIRNKNTEFIEKNNWISRTERYLEVIYLE